MRCLCNLIIMTSLAGAVGHFVAPAFAADPDLPGAMATVESIPADSLVIPMDNAKQNVGVVFNLNAYGLVKELLKNGIPVKWVIDTSKAKDGADFAATAARIAPTPLAAAPLSFSGGPFVVTEQIATAKAIVSGFGNDVAVYELSGSAMVPVLYTLTQKVHVVVLDDGGNADIHTSILDAAGFEDSTCAGGANSGDPCFEVTAAADCPGSSCARRDYSILPSPTTAAKLSGITCATIVTEPHYDEDDPANSGPPIAAVRAYLQSGGNLLAQCIAVQTYEHHPTFGGFQATNGFQQPAKAIPFVYDQPGLAFSQFVDELDDEGGSLTRFALAAGSVFQNNGYPAITFTTPASPPTYKASVSKLTSPGVGRLVFYLAGHSYDEDDIASINGRRMYLNAVLHPSARPAVCGFSILPTAPPTLPAAPALSRWGQACLALLLLFVASRYLWPGMNPRRTSRYG